MTGGAAPAPIPHLGSLIRVRLPPPAPGYGQYFPLPLAYVLTSSLLFLV